jgi:hypothetical protein
LGKRVDAIRSKLPGGPGWSVECTCDNFAAHDGERCKNHVKVDASYEKLHAIGAVPGALCRSCTHHNR